jgi:hypothetical protein
VIRWLRSWLRRRAEARALQQTMRDFERLRPMLDKARRDEDIHVPCGMVLALPVPEAKEKP